MLTFTCSCGKRLQTKEENAGRSTRCPQCGKTLVIPGALEAIQAESPAPASTDFKEEKPAIRLRRRERDDDEALPARRRAEQTSGKAVASLILGVLSFCVPVLPAIIGIVLGCIGLGDIKRSKGRLGGAGLAIAGIITAIVGNILYGISLALLVPAVQSVREAAARVQSENNLKQIALALHSFNDAYRRLPPAVVYSKEGRPLYSWRVLILPFIEGDHIYKQFKLDEPWDSRNNIRLLGAMPPVYLHPNQDVTRDTSSTCYQVFNGPATDRVRPWAAFVSSPNFPLRPFPLVQGTAPVFERGIVTRMPASFPDGTSNSILLAEAAETIPWTKPGDLAYDPHGPLPKLGGFFRDRFIVCMADGSTRFVDPRQVSEITLRNAITVNDGIPLGADWP